MFPLQWRRTGNLHLERSRGGLDPQAERDMWLPRRRVSPSDLCGSARSGLKKNHTGSFEHPPPPSVVFSMGTFSVFQMNRRWKRLREFSVFFTNPPLKKNLFFPSCEPKALCGCLATGSEQSGAPAVPERWDVKRAAPNNRAIVTRRPALRRIFSCESAPEELAPLWSSVFSPASGRWTGGDPAGRPGV